MKILNLVSNPPTYLSRHKGIVKAKKNAVAKKTLKSLAPLVKKRYKVFNKKLKRRDLHLIPRDAVMIRNKDELLSCYKNKTKKTIEIFEEIENAQDDGVLSKCPYCGITRPGTFDHYLPEASYPEFSVHALNLIPCCSECNSSKGVRLVSAGVRQYLHFYSDILPDSQFLYVNIITRPNSIAFGISFSLQQPINFDNDDWLLIKNHFKKLDLLKRYKTESNHEVSTCFTAAKSFVKNGGDDVQGFINDICDDEEEKLGRSHWRVVLKRQLSLTVAFIEHVQNEANKP